MGYQFRPFYMTKVNKEYRIGSIPNDAARLFTIETSSHSKPQMTMTRRPPQMPGYPQQSYQQPDKSSLSALFGLSGSSTRENDPIIATVIFHSLSSKIDIQLANTGQSITMKKPNLLSSSRNFYVPGLGELQWKMEDGGLFSSTRHLIDQQGIEVARYERGHRTSLFGSRADNTISVIDDWRFLDSFLEVIVITCLAAVEYDRRSEEGVGEVAGEIGAAASGE